MRNFDNTIQSAFSPLFLKAKGGVRAAFTFIEQLVKRSHLCCDRENPAHRQGKVYFTLIELLVVIAMIAILSRSKNSFFLLFSAN